jgi:broad specificity phosphatase PhoE
MSTIYMVRHGQASFGKGNYDKLSQRGLFQSRILAEYFKKLDIRFDLIYTGTLIRQIETARELLALYEEIGLPLPEVKQLEEFNEFDYKSVFTTMIPVISEEDPSFKNDVEKIFDNKRSFQGVFERVIMKWVSGSSHIEGFVSWEEFVSRVNQGIDEIMKSHGRGKQIGIFTSGGAIAVAIRKAINLSDEDTIRIAGQIVNSSVSRFKCTHDRIMLSTFNEHSHLENSPGDNLITYI